MLIFSDEYMMNYEEDNEKDQDDHENENEPSGSMKDNGGLVEMACKIMDAHHICKNGGSCALTMNKYERSPYQICSCQPGYHGLFCEKPPVTGPPPGIFFYF